MRQILLAIMCIAATSAFALTPGKAIKMVPQSGTSKSFDVITEHGITMRLQFYTPNVFRVLAAPQTLIPYRDRQGNPLKDEAGNLKTYVSANYADPLNDPGKTQILTSGAAEDKSRVTFRDNRTPAPTPFQPRR